MTSKFLSVLAPVFKSEFNRMGIPKYFSAIMFLAIFVSSCASPTTTRFTWGDYEDALYEYYKAPSELAAYREVLREAIEEGEANGKLAPGLCAELGYTYLEQGDLASARQLFELEMQHFPEARPFLGGLIQRLSPQSSDSARPVS